MHTIFKKAAIPVAISITLFLAGCDGDTAEGLVQPITDASNVVPVTEEPATPVTPPADVPVTEPVDVPPMDDPVVDPVEEPVDDPVTDPVEPPAQEPVQTPIDPTGIISSVAIGEIVGVFYSGAPPESTGSITLSPLTENADPIQFISGGSTQVPIKSDKPFISAFVVADSEGYFQVDLPEEKSEDDMIISFNTIQLDGQVDDIAVSVASAFGDISGAQTLSVSSNVVGTGELQVSVSWATPTDVDLYVTEPDGTQINFFNDSSASGGMLDLDSNAICIIDGVNNENVTYENVTPPSGEYLVEVDYYDNCGVQTPTEFLVTVRIGNDVRTARGTFQPGDDTNSRREILRFEVR